MNRVAARIAYTAAMLAILWTVLAGMLSPGHNEPADVAPTAAPVVFALSGDQMVAHEVAVISAQRQCAPASTWMRQHPHQLPASMVLKQDGTYLVTVTAWTYPAPKGQWVEGLCSR